MFLHDICGRTREQEKKAVDKGQGGHADLWESSKAGSQNKDLHHIEAQEITGWPCRAEVWTGRVTVPPLPCKQA